MNLLMTRPQGAAERFEARLPTSLRARITPVYSPLIGIEPVAGAIEFGDARGVVFSSVNGVLTAADLTDRRELPCFCVGQSTTQAAENAGWQAHYAGPTSAALVDELGRSQPDGPLLHLRGAHSRGDIAKRLSEMGVPTREKVIYDQPLLPFNDAALKVLAGNGPVIAPLFSPRSARQFANLVTGQPKLYLAALSDAVAEPVKHLNYQDLIVANRPDAEAMADAIKQLVDRAERVEGG